MQDGLARDAARAVKVLSLISRSPILFRHAKLLQAHRSTLQQHWAALTPHLPRLLDRIHLLRPHEAVFFEELPALLPHMDVVLEELPYLWPHLAGIVEHRATLLPALPLLKAHLRYLRPYYAVIAARGALLAPHAVAIAPHLMQLLPTPPFWPDTLLARIDHLAPLLCSLHAAPLALWLPHLSLVLKLEPTAVWRAVDRLGGSEVEDGKPPVRHVRMAPAVRCGAAPVDAASLQAILHQVRRPWDVPLRNGAREAAGGEAAGKIGGEAQEAGGQRRGLGAVSAPTGGDGFWDALRRKLLRDSTGAGVREAAEGHRTVSPCGAAGEGALERRRQLSALVEETGAAVGVAEARAARLEPRFREFKHDMHWRQSRDHVTALQISRAEDTLFQLEEAVLALAGETRQLQHDVEQTARVIGPEAIARGRERRLVGARPPPPKTAAADRGDFADWLLSRMPL